jgi:hypothetical protein
VQGKKITRKGKGRKWSYKYIQNNFFAGRDFVDNKSMIIKLRDWLDNYCNERVHGTTKEKPVVLFKEKELPALNQLPENDFIFGMLLLRKVHSDCHVTIDHNYYSVPYNHAGKVVEVEVTESLVKIYVDNEQIVLHAKITGKRKFATITAHYPKYKYFTNDSLEYLAKLKQDIVEIGEYTKTLFASIVKENPNSWYRTVSGILNLRKTYSDLIIKLLQESFIFFNYSISKIKSICESGCYNLELPTLLH